jgi:competence protein ComEA
MRNKKKIIGSIAILIIFFIFLAIGYSISKPAKELSSKQVFNETTSIENKDSKENKDITAYINGEVKNPGVYKMKSDSRVEDLVKLAGGFTESSDRNRLNLAKKLRDEDYIYVDKKGDVKNGTTASSALSNSGVGQNGKININTASKDELKSISGIGDVTAQKIIEYREKNGTFSTIEDLKKVGRIGDKTLEKIKDKIDVR